MINEIASDPRIWERYEVWLFIYNTGNPVAYSAEMLRQALSNTVSELDPQGTDPALRRMVLIGHSQGGLLAKMMVIDSGTRRLGREKPSWFVRVDPRLKFLRQYLTAELRRLARMRIRTSHRRDTEYAEETRFAQSSSPDWAKGYSSN